MSKIRWAIVGLVVVIVFVIGLFIGVLVPRLVGLYRPPIVHTSSSVLQQVQTLSQLVTVKYVFEKVEWVEEPSTNWFGMLFAGQNRVLILAHGIVKAGIDFQSLKPGDIRVDRERVLITLPKATISDAYLDDRKTQVIERTTGFLRQFDKDLEQNARAIAVDDIRRAARENGILAEAEERARFQLRNSFQQLGFTSVEFRTR